jgi:PAS domain-containing protein
MTIAEKASASRHSFERPDFAAAFELLPRPYLVLDTHFIIVAQNIAHAAVSLTESSETIGRLVFEVFPDNPENYSADGVSALQASLLRVLNSRLPDEMAVQRYDVRRSLSEGGNFESRYWRVLNVPILGKDGYVQWILNCPEDVTELVNFRREKSIR